MAVVGILTGQAALVTGASRGIGRAIARRLAEAGADLVLNATHPEALAGTVAAVEGAGRRARVVAGDVADPETAARMVAAAEAAFGRLDVVVNNAGLNLRAPTLEMALEGWRRVMAVNLDGTLHVCRAALPVMIAAGGGRIVNVSSAASKSPHRNAAPAYGASKAAVNYLTMHLAQEMAPYGIRVNAVCPGPVETDMTGQWDEAHRAEVLSRVPLGRLGRAEEIADVVLFLASGMSGFTTGALLDANGGTRMG